MFVPRTIRSSSDWLDADGAKIYTIAKHDGPVAQAPFHERLAHVKASRSLPWPQTAHFAIFHEGTSPYLVLCWWGNDNELFTSVSVLTQEGWAERPDLYSFCLYDMEVMWEERNAYIDTVDCADPSLQSYRLRRRRDRLDAA